MENKINIVELLKDCPRGMELDCTAFEGVKFDGIIHGSLYPIEIVTKGNWTEHLTAYGCIRYGDNAKCVIFPKGKTTWEGFVPPCKFKGGDIVVIKTSYNFIFYSIYQGIENREVLTYVDYYLGSNKLMFNATFHSLCFTDEIVEQRLATEEEKAKLFDAIKANGYKWNEETKTLEKLVKPRFKVGDRIRDNQVDLGNIYTIIEVRESSYVVNKNNEHKNYNIDFVLQDEWELVSNKFDINTLKPFDKVLVRCSSLEKWHIQFFEKYNTELGAKYPFVCLCNSKYCQCIPYENNQHLLDTANDCNDFYKTWE